VLEHGPGWTAFVLRVLVANLAMGGMLWWLAGDTAHWATMAFLQRIVRGGGYIALGAALYFAVLYATGMRYRHLRSAVS
jgi:putative peptidoglycan lipid II flippase